MARKKTAESVRAIRTVYYEDFRATKKVKTTRSLHVNTASKNCFDHMQLNHYGAVLAEIIDERKGEQLHAVFKRDVVGDVKCFFKREVKEGM